MADYSDYVPIRGGHQDLSTSSDASTPAAILFPDGGYTTLTGRAPYDAQEMGPPGTPGRSSGKTRRITGRQFIGATANVANAALGAGVLAFPYAFSACGVLEGVVLTAFFGVAMGYSLNILAKAARVTRSDSYQGTAEKLLGPVGGWVAKACMFVYTFGALVGYLDVVMDQVLGVLPLLVKSKSPLEDRGVLLLIMVPILLPLSCVRDISYLSFTSSMAVGSIVYMVVLLMALYIPDIDAAALGRITWFKGGGGVFEAIPILCFALQCHLVFVPVAHGIMHKMRGSISTTNWVAVAAMSLCVSLYVPTGFVGAVHWDAEGKQAPGDIITGLPTHETSVILSRLAMGINASFSYPLLAFVCRGCVDEMVFPSGSKYSKHSRYSVISFLLVAVSMLCAYKLSKISDVLALVGSTAAVGQVFILPGLMHIRMNPRRCCGGKVVGWAIIVGGAVVGVLGTLVAAYKLAGKHLFHP